MKLPTLACYGAFAFFLIYGDYGAALMYAILCAACFAIHLWILGKGEEK